MEWFNFISFFNRAWITIFFLIKDKFENKRPYLQITFELVRDNLTCIVLRNVGNVPLELKQIKFDEDFVNQLPEREKTGLIDNKINNIKIFPGKQWIICNSGATFRATLLEISRNILKYKGNKKPILKGINEWAVVKSLKIITMWQW